MRIRAVKIDKKDFNDSLEKIVYQDARKAVLDKLPNAFDICQAYCDHVFKNREKFGFGEW